MTVTVTITPGCDAHRMIRARAYLASARELLRMGHHHIGAAAALHARAARLLDCTAGAEASDTFEGVRT